MSLNNPGISLIALCFSSLKPQQYYLKLSFVLENEKMLPIYLILSIDNVINTNFLKFSIFNCCFKYFHA